MVAMKKADERDAVIMRLLNNTPERRTTYVEVNGKRLPLQFGKYEVKTVLYEKGTLTESYDLLI